MHVRILGTGTCAPSMARSSASIVLSAGKSLILFDVGPGTVGRMVSAGVRIFDIDAILLSHFHPDHSGELASFLFSNRYAGSTKREKRLVIAGGPGMETFFKNLKATFFNWIDLGDKLEVRSLMPFDEMGIGGVRIKAFPVAHNPESIAFRVEDEKGRAMAFSGDTDFCKELVELAMGVDLLICECSMPEGRKVSGHLTPSEAGRIASLAGAGLLLLTHFYPETESFDISAQCRTAYLGPLLLARDMMEIELLSDGKTRLFPFGKELYEVFPGQHRPDE